MRTWGHNAGIMHTLEVELSPKAFGQAAFPSGFIGGLPFVFAKRCVDLPEVMSFAAARPSPKIGQFAQPDIQLESAPFDRDGLPLLPPVWICSVPQKTQGRSRIGI